MRHNTQNVSTNVSVKQHKVKLTTLVMCGIGTMIGSGWLFSAAHAAAAAGPAATISWVIGAVMVLFIAFNLATITSIVPPKMGGAGYCLNYTHGSFSAFIAEWTILIGFISSIPSESTASTQYLSSWHYAWANNLYNVHSSTLTTNGLLVSSLLCIVYFLVNYYSLSFLARSIKMVTFFKLIVPLIAIGSFLLIGFAPSHISHLQYYSLAPYGYSGIFTAITSAGIVYAFNGFQAPLSFAAEAHNPKRDIPIALVVSVLVTTVIYVLLQVAYLVAVPHEMVASIGWNGLNFSSPFANLAIALNINLVALLLYVDAFISPSGAGIIYTSLSARVMFSLGSYLPGSLNKVHQDNLLPRNAMLVVLVLCFVALWLLPSWDKLAAVISVGYVLCYTTVPVCARSLDRLLASGNLQHKQNAWLKVIAPVSFVLATFMLYWSRWPLNGEVIFIVLIGLPFYLYYHKSQHDDLAIEVRKSLWLIAYLLFVALFGFIGSNNFGGINLIPSGIDHVLMAIIALGFYYWGGAVCYKTKLYLKELEKTRS